MTLWRAALAGVMAAGLAAACGPAADLPAAADRAADATRADSSSGGASAQPLPEAATQLKAAEPQVLTAQGLGPLRIGMTLAEVTAAWGPDSNPEAVGGPEPERCDQFHPARAPEGTLVMIEDGRLTNVVLIRSSEVRTDRDIGLGAPAEAVRSTYGAAALPSPNRYAPAPAGSLTVWTRGGQDANGNPTADALGVSYRIGADGRVESIAAGGPSILYAEGCA